MEEIVVSEMLKRLVLNVTKMISRGSGGVKDDMRKLQIFLEILLTVMADAEKRQLREEGVRLWLKRLKDVAYDADDVLDEFSYEAMRRADQMRSLKDKVRDFASSSNPIVFPFMMAPKIKSINEKLDEIAKDMRDFGFLTISTPPRDQSREHPNRQTVSYVEDSEIMGRENDKSEIVKLLFMTNNTPSSPSSSSSSSSIQNNEKVSVISIVGMGGLGKTTLARSVYNDESVVKHFDIRMWVCVADDYRPFDEFKILRDIMEQIDNSFTLTGGGDEINKEVLWRRFKEELDGKKYLLVLDDLWNEDCLKWHNFKSRLNVGADGSKIIVTTRKNQVAINVRGTIPPYNLSEAQCWSIISRKAFSPGGALETPNMINLGKEIAKKCCGLPLAAIFLGDLMRSRRDESEWRCIVDHNDVFLGDHMRSRRDESEWRCIVDHNDVFLGDHMRSRREESEWRSIIDHNDVWNEVEDPKNIIPILKLSYDNLPSHLKQCFSYCCIFPKDWDIKKETLIQLWMAEGFLPSESEKSMEDIGNEYLKDLLSRSFFQDVTMNDLGDIETCKMQDLMHELAQMVSDESRRLSLVLKDGISRSFQETFPNVNANRLRAIVDLGSFSHLDLKSLSSNKYLRILHFHSLSAIDDLSSWIPNMKCLRYLHLSLSGIKSGAELNLDLSTISSLYNLQTLVLRNSRNVQKLPRNIGSLENLRYLDVSNTGIKVLPDSITSLYNLRTLKFHNCPKLKALPSDFGKLKHLRYLDTRGTKIEVLPESCTENLTNLEIVHLGGQCALPTEIKNWMKLRHLTLWSWENDDELSYQIKGRNEMPRGIEQLTSLRILNPYVVRKQVSYSSRRGGIEELHGLNFLEYLRICCLENVRGPMVAEKANLMGKLILRKLDLEWNSEADDNERGSDHAVVVLEALQPHPNLEQLFIKGFNGFESSYVDGWWCSIIILSSDQFGGLEAIRLRKMRTTSSTWEAPKS